MFKLKAGVFANDTYRNLISRVLRENFHLYVGRYILAFSLMGCAAVATGASAYLMKNITEVIFATPHELNKLPGVKFWV